MTTELELFDNVADIPMDGDRRTANPYLIEVRGIIFNVPPRLAQTHIVLHLDVEDATRVSEAFPDLIDSSDIEELLESRDTHNEEAQKRLDEFNALVREEMERDYLPLSKRCGGYVSRSRKARRLLAGQRCLKEGTHPFTVEGRAYGVPSTETFLCEKHLKVYSDRGRALLGLADDGDVPRWYELLGKEL